MLASIFMTDIVLFQKISTNSFLSSRNEKQVRLLVLRNKTKSVRSFLFKHTLGEGKGSPMTTRPGRRMPSFLGGKSRGALRQAAFFLAGNCMTIVVSEKEVSLKSLSLFI